MGFILGKFGTDSNLQVFCRRAILFCIPIENLATKKLFYLRPKSAYVTIMFRGGSNVAKHAWTFNHAIDFNCSQIIDTANNRNWKTLESWHTAKTAEEDNNSCPLPRQYNILLKKH